ncbi:hypothetical protein GCM10011289_36230 [Paludibacterium paludis]|uniref:Uncharacterized protein n=1 Tax=Paludibacterium paludis TaxID=1225769 RepID=A0A918P765_9NEIS|nr:hypothetical protein GCM10011289_36230 [Paludibacterium paludis]
MIRGQIQEAVGSVGRNAATSAKPGGIPASLLDANGKLPPGIGGVGTPIPMPPSVNPNATAEAFAKSAFNGQTPLSVNPIKNGNSWVAKLPDGTVVTYRVAGDASGKTNLATATVEGKQSCCSSSK